MSSNNQHMPSSQKPNNPNPPPGFGSVSWMTDPFGLTTPTNRTPSVNDVGNGQQSSYQERTYTLPGSQTYYEWSS